MKRLAAIGLLLILPACAGGPSRDQVDRSQREYQLGVGLWGERNAPGAFEHVLEAIELDPDNAEAHHFLGNLFWIVRRDFARAEHHLREALRANTAVPGPTGLAADVKNSLGVMMIHARRYDEAVVTLREAASDLMNRQPAVSWANLGWAYHEADDNARALEALTQAVQMSPQLCVGWFRLGQVRASQDEWQPALDALDRALEVEDPTCAANQMAWRLRGEVHAQLGHRDEALRDLERCVELSSDTEDGQACRRLLGASPAHDSGVNSGADASP